MTEANYETPISGKTHFVEPIRLRHLLNNSSLKREAIAAKLPVPGPTADRLFSRGWLPSNAYTATKCVQVLCEMLCVDQSYLLSEFEGP